MRLIGLSAEKQLSYFERIKSNWLGSKTSAYENSFFSRSGLKWKKLIVRVSNGKTETVHSSFGVPNSLNSKYLHLVKLKRKSEQS